MSYANYCLCLKFSYYLFSFIILGLQPESWLILSFSRRQVNITFLKPMSLAYSLKHCLQMFRPYLRIRPCLLEQARLEGRRESLKHVLQGYDQSVQRSWSYLDDFLPWAGALSISTGVRVPNICVTHGDKIKFFAALKRWTRPKWS